MYNYTWKFLQNTVNWCNSKLAQRKGLQFYQTRSYAITLFYNLFAICHENVVYMKCTAKCINLRVCREEPYAHRSCIMDVRIFLIPTREHPPTIKANEARGTGRLVARSFRRLEEVTWTSESKVYHTPQSRKKTMIAETWSRN